MLDIFLFLAFAFLFTIIFGRLIERIRVPWIFAALLLGSLLAIYNPFAAITSSQTFIFLAQLGMYFLLFMIGFELDLNKLKKDSKFIFKATFFVIFLEAIFGTLIIHFVFGYAWFISFIVALSFATVGEAVLIPILDEFKIVNTKLGQSIIGIGTMDDMIEICILILIIFLIGSSASINYFNITIILFSITVLFALAYGLTKLKKSVTRFNILSIEALFLFVLFIMFLFLGVGSYAESTPLAALLAGIAIRNFIPEKRLKIIKSEIKTMAYGFFAPLFFLQLGSTMDMNYIIAYPLLVLLVVAVSNTMKILGSYLIGRKHLGTRKSILLGIGLSVRFSTSIIIIKLLLDSGLIGLDLYSVIIASTIVFKFIVPVLFSNLLVKWNVSKVKK